MTSLSHTPSQTGENTPQISNTLSTCIFSSHELLKDAKEIHIHHQGMIYRLRRTKSDKLILTK